MCSTPKMKLSYGNRLDRVWFMTKTRQDNDLIDRIGLVYAKNDIELSRLIWLTVIYDENETGQWLDQLYRCRLHKNQNRIVRTYRTRCGMLPKPNKTMTWSTIQVGFTLKKKIELSWPIGLSAIYDENQRGQRCDRSYRLVYSKTKTKLLSLILLGDVCDENQIGQWLDRSYRYYLRQKWYWFIMIDRIKCDLWWKPYKTTTL